MRALLLTILAVGMLLAVFRLALPRLVPALVYYPEPLDPARSGPAAWGHEDAEELWLTTEDGVRLHAWWFPARAERCGVALFLHGNAGHLAPRGPIAESLAYLGFEVLLPDYRGYGRSEGRPDEPGLYRDAEAAYRAALERSDLPAERLLAMGNSLGSSVAVDLAARRPLGALVLVSPFPSTVAVGRRAYPYLPGWLLDWKEHRFDVEERIRRIEAPVLVLRGGRDRLIAEEDSRAVFEAIAGAKAWHQEPEADHNQVLAMEGSWMAVRDFTQQHLRCP